MKAARPQVRLGALEEAEAAAAVGAHPPLRMDIAACVHALVRDQLLARAKGLAAAPGADERLELLVHALLMGLGMASSQKYLAAGAAAEAPRMHRVRALVLPPMIVGFGAMRAPGAGERAHVKVHLHDVPAGMPKPAEAAVALHALKRPLARVHAALMLSQVAAGGERLAAAGAYGRSPVCVRR